MNILVHTDDPLKKFKFMLSFDVYGNLYFDGNFNKKNEYFVNEKNLLFQINISGKDIPYAEEGDYKIIESFKNKINEFTVLDKDNSLKAKIKKKINQEINDEDYDSDEEYDLEGDKNNINYYPEDDDYVNNDNIDLDSENFDNEIDEDNIKKYGYNNLKFNFNKSDNNKLEIEINNRENGDIMSLYDVYIYDNNNLIFKSNSADNSSIYRFRIFLNGDIYFRSIGNPEIKYKLYITSEGILQFIS